MSTERRDSYRDGGIVPPFGATRIAVSLSERKQAVLPVFYKPGSMIEIAGEMTGKGSVRDGRVAVDMTTTSGNLSGKFEGKVSNAEMTLTGTETVKIAGRGEDQRPCKALLTRGK